MSDAETSGSQPPQPPDRTQAPETKAPARSFTTSQGSVYTYDDEGKTTRFRTETGEQQPRQDLTVFVSLADDEVKQVVQVLKNLKDPSIASTSKAYPYVIQRQPDNSVINITDVADVTDPSRLYLAIARDGQYIFTRQASLTPASGLNVFERRNTPGGEGQAQEQWHLGNRVTQIVPLP